MDLGNLSIESTRNLLEALKQMDALDKKLLIVVDKTRYIGLLSAGDVQRAIIKNKPLTTLIHQVLRKNIRVGKPDDSFDTIKKMMLNYRMEFCPIVDQRKSILKIHFWDDIFLDQRSQPVNKFNLPVIIMAGGFGTRLEPLTKVLPKPLFQSEIRQC
jgi:CBS domain-containing protein